MRLHLALCVVFVLVAGCSAVPNPGTAPTATTASPSYPPPLADDQKVTISFTNYNVAQAGIGKEATE